MTALKSTEHLSSIMRDAKARTLELLDGLTDAQLMGPHIDIVNPLLWEIGHVAWFSEFFIARQLDGAGYGPDRLILVTRNGPADCRKQVIARTAR